MADQRRILLLNTDLEIGGTPTVVRELALRLRGPAVSVEVACLSSGGPTADALRARDVNVTAFNARGPRNLIGVVRKLNALIAATRVDTVVSFLVHANVVAALALRGRRDVRLIESIQTVQPRPRWHWLAQRFAARAAERIVVPSTAIATVADRRSGIARERCVVIPNAVDPDEFDRCAVFNRIPIRAGYIGRLDSAKRPEFLLPALKALPGELTLTYFGDGPARTNIQARARQLGVEEAVRFRGFVDRPQEALCEIDVLWLASPVEGFGLVLIEALAAGVPVVALRAGGTCDVLLPGENALSTDDAADWSFYATATRRLRDDVALRECLIAGGLRTVREKFSWAVVLPAYRALLRLP